MDGPKDGARATDGMRKIPLGDADEEGTPISDVKSVDEIAKLICRGTPRAFDTKLQEIFEVGHQKI